MNFIIYCIIYIYIYYITLYIINIIVMIQNRNNTKSSSSSTIVLPMNLDINNIYEKPNINPISNIVCPIENLTDANELSQEIWKSQYENFMKKNLSMFPILKTSKNWKAEYTRVIKFKHWDLLKKSYNQIDKNIVIVEKNSMDSLPKEIFLIPDLKDLIIFYSNLKEIPTDIQNLTNLESLQIYGDKEDENRNKIKVIPSEIKHLRKLSWLIIKNQDLEIIPPEIKYCRLTNLNLSGNKIVIVPPEIRINTLKTLNLSNNHIVDISEIH